MQQPTLLLLSLCSHPLKMLYNLPSGTRSRSWTGYLPTHAENKAFIFKLLSLTEFSHLPLWTQQNVFWCAPCLAHIWVMPLRLSMWLGNTISYWTPRPLVLLPSLLQWCQSLGCRSCFMDTSVATGIHNSAFWLAVVFCSGLHWLQREFSLSRGKGYTSLWE